MNQILKHVMFVSVLAATISVCTVATRAFSRSAFADEPVAWDLKVTSFLPVVNFQSRLGEICGRVTGPVESLAGARVAVVSDPKTKRPGYYATAVDNQGRFCLVIHTFTGTAEATVQPTGEASPPPAGLRVEWALP